MQHCAASSRRQEEHRRADRVGKLRQPRVLAAQGSGAHEQVRCREGYPGRRYYGGCEYVDVAERLAIDRAKQLFNADYRERAAALRVVRPTSPFHGAAAAGRH